MVKKKTINIEKHNLMPKHTVCSDKEKTQILEKYNATIKDLPKILQDDAALMSIKVKLGDLVKIERDDPVTKKTVFYRVVSDE